MGGGPQPRGPWGYVPDPAGGPWKTVPWSSNGDLDWQRLALD